ncbi:hypothetical protein SAMN06295909_2641 [Plantibacter sp. VKM Ac-1784]|uniref:Nucleotidyltransferase n=1 Tax=Plantibacter elymi (nom. nud.) TaxID=199708 RepID=A0ABY1RGU8_9MICO|nr:nucleotidyltransferase [Plantibacter sp. VKM Ac-1784]SMQ72344.1 hypothetical protein SAMN06295909_2641 [Plantibacter sp. VKM Ac-1784]
MKLEGHFNALLKDTVNLSLPRLEKMESRAESIYGALQDDSTVGPMVVKKTRQGSWAQGTIINPPAGKDFDADFTLQLELQEGWEPQDYLRAVRRALKDSTIYGEMTLERKNRCVRVVYANAFHVDVVPAVVQGAAEYIANYETNSWELTNPDGFTVWMQEKDATAQSNLRRVIRLMKYVRHHRGFTGVRSIILTTLLGEQVEASRKFADPGYYQDLPTAFTHLICDLDDYIWPQIEQPSVADPSGTGLTFDHRWLPGTYSNFRSRLHSIAETTRAAFASSNRDESEELWREIFGDRFTDGSKKTDPRPFAPTVTPGYVPGRAG